MITSVVLCVLLATAAIAAPTEVQKRANPSETDILQYALTLEHLENAFYAGALSRFNAKAFAKAGYAPWVRQRFEQIAAHEKQHVTFLSAVLGAAATKPCTYSFPYTDPRSFAALAQVLEGVGVSAYLGAAHYITTPSYVTAASAILTTESRHSAWVSAALNKGAAWSSALDTPLDLNQVYSLAAAFIKSCPATNPALPIKAFPTLSVTTKNPLPGKSVSLKYASKGGQEYLVLFHGLVGTAVPITGGKATLPPNLSGTVYAIVSSAQNTISDDTTVAGPAVLLFSGTQ